MNGSGVASGVVTLSPVGPYTSPDGQSGGSSSIWGRVVSLAKVVTPLMVSVAVTALVSSAAWVVVGVAATLYMAYREFTTPDVATKLLPLSLPLQNQSGLYLGMHKDGVHGCAREYFGNHKPFSLVNVSGPTGDLRSGLSKQIADNAGVSYKTDLRRQVQQSQLAGGDCLTFTGRSDYKTRTELGMTKCHSIFTVISPNKRQDGCLGCRSLFMHSSRMRLVRESPLLFLLLVLDGVVTVALIWQERFTGLINVVPIHHQLFWLVGIIQVVMIETFVEIFNLNGID